MGRAKPIDELSQWKNLLLCRVQHQLKTENKDKVSAVVQKQDGNPEIHSYMLRMFYRGKKTRPETSTSKLLKTFPALFCQPVLKFWFLLS